MAGIPSGLWASALGVSALWASAAGAQPAAIPTPPDTLVASDPLPAHDAQRPVSELGMGPVSVTDALVADTLDTASMGTEPIAGDVLVAEGQVAASQGSAAPRSFLWRSGLLPGWGQWRSGHPFKAILFGGAAISWAAAVTVEHGRIDQATPLEKQGRVGRRNTRVLWYVITATAAALDAYVDAHLDDFNVEEGFALAVNPAPGGPVAFASWRTRF